MSTSPNNDLNAVVNKTKRRVVQAFNLFLSCVLEMKTQYENNYSPLEKGISDDFVKIFQEHVVFYIKQLHESVSWSLLVKKPLTTDVSQF